MWGAGARLTVSWGAWTGDLGSGVCAERGEPCSIRTSGDKWSPAVCTMLGHPVAGGARRNQRCNCTRRCYGRSSRWGWSWGWRGSRIRGWSRRWIWIYATSSVGGAGHVCCPTPVHAHAGSRHHVCPVPCPGAAASLTSSVTLAGQLSSCWCDDPPCSRRARLSQVNIFELASVAVPIHVPSHWYAIGIDIQRRVVAVIDSLRPQSGSLADYIDAIDAVHRCVAHARALRTAARSSKDYSPHPSMLPRDSYVACALSG